MTLHPAEVRCQCGASGHFLEEDAEVAEQQAVDFRDTHDCALRDPADAEWITPEVAALVLARAADRFAPLPYEQVLAELDASGLREDA